MRKDDIVARLGGDEFALIQMGAPQPRAAESLAARIIDVMSAPFDIHGYTVNVGASIGIALAPADASDAVDLMKHADMALYVSKSQGRGRATVYRPEMSDGLQERHALESDLRRAFDAGEFVLHYQPIVDLQTRQVIAVEALIRWLHPTRGLVWPAAFLQAAEECGLLVQLGAWVLRRACLDAAAWHGTVRVAVNVSAKQFQARGFCEVVHEALAGAGLAADRLELEIRESVMLKNDAQVRDILEALRASGVHLSLDDFGTAYTSLSCFRKAPIEKIKIDKSFIKDLGTTADAEAIVRAMVSFGENFGLPMVAEGIETEDQASRVLAAKCREGQGYLFSRAVPASDVMDVIARLDRTDVMNFDHAHAGPACRQDPATFDGTAYGVEGNGAFPGDPVARGLQTAPTPVAESRA
jgi:predicted signal transduction protein with EAL and GGDEF domain